MTDQLKEILNKKCSEITEHFLNFSEEKPIIDKYSLKPSNLILLGLVENIFEQAAKEIRQATLKEVGDKVEEQKNKLTMKWDSDKYQSWAFDKVKTILKELVE